MADRTRAFNWNGGASLSAVPGYSTSAPAATSVEVIPAHFLHGLHAYNLASVPLFVQLFDGISVPAAGAIPLRSYPIPSTGALASTGLGGGTLDVDVGGRFFSAGIVVGLSSVGTSFVVASVGTMYLDAQYT